MKKSIFVLALFTALLVFGDAGVMLPEGWEPLVGSQNNMSLYAQVEDWDGNLLATPGSVLGVFDADGICRGAGELSEGPSGLWFQLLVVSNLSQESGLVLKVLDARDGELHDLQETLDFEADSIFPPLEPGKPLSTVTLHYKPLQLDQALALEQNWNWVSFQVAQGESTIQEFLADYAKYATDGDIIKSQTGQATFSDGEWYASPADFQLEPGRMYKFLKQSAGSCTITVTGLPADPLLAIPVVAGWNWLGYVGEAPATIGAIYSADGFADGDLLKPQAGNQATFSGDQWYGQLQFQPGQGYMLKRSAEGTVDFRNAKANPVD